jgi:hypothetical protein
MTKRLSDEVISQAIKNRSRLKVGHHESYDCIRIAYEWLDAQARTQTCQQSSEPLKHIIEAWGRRYLSQSDVEVAAQLHPDIQGEYPSYNISRRFIRPSRGRLDSIREANSQDTYDRNYQDVYSRSEFGN